MSDFIKITSKRGLKYLKHQLKDTICNGITASSDKNGHPIFCIGYDNKPDSDWGKWRVDYIVFCTTKEFYQQAYDIACDAIGWDRMDALIVGSFAESEAA